MEREYWFKSELFQVQKNEDKETNPGCYGKELSEWLAEKLKKQGYKVEGIIPEDWGWCVICVRKEYLLWVGCGSRLTENVEEVETFETNQIIWHVFPVIEIPWYSLKSQIKRLLGKLDINQPLNKLAQELKTILSTEPKIQFHETP